MKQTTDRRSFLKSGAVVAAPLAVAAPALALAEDGSAARLARLEDERAIEALHRDFLRSEQVRTLAPGLRAIAEDGARDATLEVAADSATAVLWRPVVLELQTEFTGDSTLEKMARFEGQGSHRYTRRGVLAANYVKDKQGWRLASATLA